MSEPNPVIVNKSFQGFNGFDHAMRQELPGKVCPEAMGTGRPNRSKGPIWAFRVLACPMHCGSPTAGGIAAALDQGTINGECAMETPIYVSLSRQTALRRQMEVVANNVANMSTPGYKQQRVLFQEFLHEPPGGAPVSMVVDYGVRRDTRNGALTATGNPLDLALEGDGYFVVETLNGPRYTRAGRFQLDNERRIVDVNGLPLLGQGGQPLAIPDGAADIIVRPDGTVATELGEVGQIDIVRFEDEQAMLELGSGLYSSPEDPVAVEDTLVRQGMIEGSNVQGVVEMTQMIEISRQYQQIQKILESEHRRQLDAIKDIGTVS